MQSNQTIPIKTYTRKIKKHKHFHIINSILDEAVAIYPFFAIITKKDWFI